MLETVLEIGRKVRTSKEGLKHHRYIKGAPVFDEKKNPVRFWIVPVNSDGSFDFAKLSPLLDENRQKQIFYLNYKSSDADSTKPYVFGDVYRSVTKLGEDGNFRFGDPEKKSWMAKNSFERGESLDALSTEVAKNFRISFREQMASIEAFLRENPNTYIHFSFNGKGWHELDELNLLNEKLLSGFFEKSEDGYVLKAFLYKTMTSDRTRMPNFVSNSRRLHVFKSADQALDLLYGINYASKAVLRQRDVKVVVLPRGKNLTGKQIERFFERSTAAEPKGDDIEVAEKSLVADDAIQSSTSNEDSFLDFLPQGEDAQDFVQFDFVFSKAGGTQSDVDLIEFSGVEHSKLFEISKRIRHIRKQTEKERLLVFAGDKALSPLHIFAAFRNILGDATREQKKYQSHLLSVLPQLYTGTYYNDPILLPALIQKTEFNIRNEQANFRWLKFDFYFLTRLQDSFGEDRLMNIQSSQSYHVGFLLGKIAKQFSGPKSPIKSFEKNYVGLLSRRIGTLPDVVQLANDINQKLVMHELTRFTSRTSTQLAQSIREFQGAYNKNECAFGFFESYFAPLPPKSSGTEDEDLDGTNPDVSDDETVNG